MTGDGKGRRRAGDGIGDLIVECLRAVTLPTPSSAVDEALTCVYDLRKLPAAAEHHGVAPAVHRVLRRADIPPDVTTALEQSYQRQWQIHLRALADLAELVKLVDDLGVGWVVVKGPVLSEAFYQRLDIRSYVDLDAMVHRSSLPVVLDALEAGGAVVVDRNWTLIRNEMRGELTLSLRHGTTLDLHWHLFNERRVRRAFQLSMEDLISRARRVSVNGISTPTLDGADTLVYLAAHAGLAGGYRLVWFKDLEQVIASEAPDWDHLIRVCRSSGLTLVVATMLARARRVLGAEVPPDVLDALAPRAGWRTVIAAADRLSPPQHSFGHQLTARTLVSATRRSGAASALELARASWTDVIKPVFTQPSHPWRRAVLRPNESGWSVNPLRTPSGEIVDREAFLRSVSQAPVDP